LISSKEGKRQWNELVSGVGMVALWGVIIVVSGVVIVGAYLLVSNYVVEISTLVVLTVIATGILSLREALSQEGGGEMSSVSNKPNRRRDQSEGRVPKTGAQVQVKKKPETFMGMEIIDD